MDGIGVGGFPRNAVVPGDCRAMIGALPDESVDIIVSSPPYWGQRLSGGNGIEDDPRRYVAGLAGVFTDLLPKLKQHGLLWINLGDAYNTPVNWRPADHTYSTLGPGRAGLDPGNSAYAKPRYRRRPYTDSSTAWLRYGSLLALPYRLVVALADAGWLFRGEVIWRKKNPMPEGRCRRPHRQHESIYLFARTEQHAFRALPPVGSVWEFASEKAADGMRHFSRFPEELPARCIQAYGRADPAVLVLDPFSGSGTTGVAALRAGCSYLGFEIDRQQAAASNQRLQGIIPAGPFRPDR